LQVFGLEFFLLFCFSVVAFVKLHRSIVYQETKSEEDLSKKGIESFWSIGCVPNELLEKEKIQNGYIFRKNYFLLLYGKIIYQESSKCHM